MSMRADVRLCGLALSVAAEGAEDACAAFAAALAPHAPGAAFPEDERLSLEVKLLAGLQPAFDRLAVSRSGDGFAVSGDGLSGELLDRSAKLSVYGGSAWAIQTAMRLACALWLAPRSGLLLHGASVDIDGRALAFLGQSGAGKTTLSRRLAAQGVRVIADEVAATRWVEQEGGGSARLFGHPLPRRLGDGLAPVEGLPLAAMGILTHAAPGAGPRVTRLSPLQAARAMLQRIFLPAADRTIVEGALGTIGAFSRAVPVYSLSLPDDVRAGHAALSILEARS